jgi:hypothetical protein
MAHNSVKSVARLITMKAITRCCHSEEQVPEVSCRLTWRNKTTFDDTLIMKGFDTMNEQQPRAIWGLNFLQDMKGEPSEITGAYDSEQQLWISQGQVQNGLIPKGFSGGLDNLPVRNKRNMGTRTQESYKGGTNTSGGRDKDSRYDTDDD